MIIILALFAIVLILISYFKPKRAFYLLLAFIPFHAFLITWINQLIVLSSTQQIILASWKEIILAVLSIKIIYQAIKTTKFPFKILIVDELIAGLFLLSLVTIPILTKDLNTAIWGLRYDFELFFIYAIVRSFKWQKSEIQKSLGIILSVGLIVAVFAILQATVFPSNILIHFGYANQVIWNSGQNLPAFQQIGGSGIIRTQSFLAGPNQLGSYLLILIPISLSLIYYQKTKKAKILFIFYFLLFTFALFFTYSRSAWLAFFILLGFYAWIILNKKGKIYIFSGVILIILAISLILKNSASDHFINIFIEHQGSTQERYEAVRQAWFTILQNPFGLGIGKAGLASLRSAQTPAIIPENWYLQIALELGILGLFVYLAIVGRFFYNLYKKFRYAVRNIKDNTEKTILLSTFLAFIATSVYSLFLHTWSDISTTMTFWILIGLCFSLNLRKRKEIE